MLDSHLGFAFAVELHRYVERRNRASARRYPKCAVHSMTSRSVMSSKTLDQRIESRPGVLGGKPCIAGRRIAVEHIVVWHERLGMSADEIAGEYDLELADVYAALAYYFAHRVDIDQSIREGKETAQLLRAQNAAVLEEKLGRSSASK